MASKNKIKLKCFGEDQIFNETANAAISPGMILEYLTTDKVKAHATAGGNVVPLMVALENSLEGEDYSDDYAADEKVRIWQPRRGDEGLMLLKDGENVSKYDKLESDGAGRLQKHTADKESWESATPTFNITVYPNQLVAVTLEAKDLSSSSGQESSGLTGHQLIKVRFV